MSGFALAGILLLTFAGGFIVGGLTVGTLAAHRAHDLLMQNERLVRATRGQS